MREPARFFVLHAPNVHRGGGRALLLPLLEAIAHPATVLLDTRLSPLPTMDPRIAVLRFPPTLLGRLRAEVALRRLSVPEARILCFGNLPPLLVKATQNTAVFLQNRYLLPPTSLSGLPFRVRMRLLAERIWLRSRCKRARLIVQSDTMAEMAFSALGREAEVAPFIAKALPTAMTDSTIDYLYVASGEEHKNHAILLSAWKRLAEDGLTPLLGLTLSTKERTHLSAPIKAAQDAGARIEMLDPRSPDQMPAVYASARAVIYPSLFESFGLPLIEAQAAGLPILAAERDYVRDFVDPVESFDPASARSIARAVYRHIGQNLPRPAIKDARAFLNHARGPK